MLGPQLLAPFATAIAYHLNYLLTPDLTQPEAPRGQILKSHNLAFNMFYYISWDGWSGTHDVDTHVTFYYLLKLFLESVSPL
jgi:hypothetical protein